MGHFVTCRASSGRFSPGRDRAAPFLFPHILLIICCFLSTPAGSTERSKLVQPMQHILYGGEVSGRRAAHGRKERMARRPVGPSAGGTGQ